MSEKLMRMATNFKERFTSHGHVLREDHAQRQDPPADHCVDHLAKPLYTRFGSRQHGEPACGNHVTSRGWAASGRAPQRGGVVVFNLQDVPLGFGILAQPTAACRTSTRRRRWSYQAGVGEYLRLEHAA